jgi:hypothetical protein
MPSPEPETETGCKIELLARYLRPFSDYVSADKCFCSVRPGECHGLHSRLTSSPMGDTLSGMKLNLSILLGASLLLAQTGGANAEDVVIRPRIAKAYCDDSGAHVVYDNGKEFFQRIRNGETCSQLTISDDNRSVGWAMTHEATAEDDKGKVIQRWIHGDLFVNGVQIEYDEACLYDWRFYDGGRQLIFEAGPLHGGGNMFLYDVEKKKIIDQYNKRDPGVTTRPIWASK